MASTYRAEMSAPQIYPTGGMIGVLDQAKPSIFAAAIRQGDSYVRPSGNATFYFTVYRGGEVIQAERSLSLPVTTSEGTPPWSAVTVPANTFPADDDGWGAGGGLIVHYRITYSGWGGVVTVPLDDSGSLKIGYFGTIKPPRTVGMTPESGAFVDDRAANTFRWNIEYNKDYTVSTPVAQASAVFQWRNGSSGTVNSVNVSGAGQSAVIPANTFPVSTAALQWQISRVTMADGAVWEADADSWINLTTIDSLSAARIVSPSGAYLTGNVGTCHRHRDGADQSRPAIFRRRGGKLGEPCRCDRRGAECDHSGGYSAGRGAALAGAYLQLGRYGRGMERSGPHRRPRGSPCACAAAG